MEAASLNRKETRRALKLISQINKLSARRELLKMAPEPPNGLVIEALDTGSGSKIAVCITAAELRHGEQEKDGFCTFDAYDQDGEHMIGWGGDGIDLLEGLTRKL